MTDWNKLKIVDLKVELKKRGLPQAGLKAALVARLNENESQDSSESEATVQDDTKNDAESAASPDTVASTHQHSSLTNEIVVEDAPPVDATKDALQVARGGTSKIGDLPSGDEPKDDGRDVGESTRQSATALARSTPPQPSRPDNVGSGPSSVEPQELYEDRMKRKRRSQSPPPLADDVARKRFKGETPKETTAVQSGFDRSGRQNATDVEAVDSKAMEDVPTSAVLPELMVVDKSGEGVVVDMGAKPNDSAVDGPNRGDQTFGDNHPVESEQDVHITANTRDSRFTGLFGQSTNPETQPLDSPNHDFEMERDIEPAIHPATSALYIKNLMRPLQSQLMQSHLAMLAAAPGSDTDPEVILNFYLDPIKTHAFVVLKTVSAASRIRNSFHDRIWPDEKTRKPLWVDFVPVEKAEDWIVEEMASHTGPRSQKKWEVDYRIDEDRNVTAVLQEVNPNRQVHPVRQPSGPGSSQQSVRHFDPPSGPRGFNRMQRPQAGVGKLNELFQCTTTRPILYFNPVAKELANRRLDSIDAALSKDAAAGRRVDGNINRYTFEDGDRLVDRGPEIFSGIRPPPGHRGGRGGRGGASYRDRGGRDYDSRDGRRNGGYREDRYDSYRAGPRNDRRY